MYFQLLRGILICNYAHRLKKGTVQPQSEVAHEATPELSDSEWPPTPLYVLLLLNSTTKICIHFLHLLY